MNALETYPPFDSGELLGNPETDYNHAQEVLGEKPPGEKVGTLSKDEWEAATLYVIFAFKKMNF